MTNINPLSNYGQADWFSQGQSQLDSLSSDQTLSFLDMFQTSLTGGFGAPESNAASGISSYFSGMMYMVMAQIFQADQSGDVPVSWNNFPSLEKTTWGYELQNVSGGYPYSRYPQNTPVGNPVEGRISQDVHNGHVALDYSVVVGTPIKTTLDGVVKHVGYDPDGYGNYIIVKNGSYEVYFAHLSETGVSMGDSVRAGQVIGLSGNTGNSTGPHLHYEIRQSGRPIDPRKYLKKNGR